MESVEEIFVSLDGLVIVQKNRRYIKLVLD